uniref:NADH dehydrogenase [ubiquinone] 1 subunit C1, mitochondrial n=1 Tax=Chelydra serpentina TaxID=8475 RepID=A0A8C3SJS6_CHESE
IFLIFAYNIYNKRKIPILIPFSLTRSAFIARKPDYTNPNWGMVGLTFGTTAALWVLLFKKHNEDVMEYERRREEREKHDACTGCS